RPRPDAAGARGAQDPPGLGRAGVRRDEPRRAARGPGEDRARADRRARAGRRRPDRVAHAGLISAPAARGDSVGGMTTCPCTSGKEFDACCGPILAGNPAPTAEALMRSRYTAYVKGAVDHILRSTTPRAAKDVDRASTEKWSRESTWLGLDVVSTEKGGPLDD